MNEQQIIQTLKTELEIPIHEVKSQNNVLHISTTKGNTVLSIPFRTENDEIKYNISLELLNKENWNTLVSDYLDQINQKIKISLNLIDFRIYTDKPYHIEVTDSQENFICYLDVRYIQNTWVLTLKKNKELARLKQEVSELKELQEESIIDPQVAFMSKGMDMAARIYESYADRKSKSENQYLELDNSFEREELKIVNGLDKRDKIYKGIMLFICIGALSLLAVFDKAPSVAPVIGVVIGLVLQNNIITEYFTGSGKKKKIKSNIDYD